MRIYLDHNTGSPMRPAVHDAIARVGASVHGNPASIHRAGQRARRALEQAREQVATLLGASPRGVVFTSGGTESNNLAIFGIAQAASGKRSRIVTSAIEHSSVMAAVAELENRAFEVTRVAPTRDGQIDPGAITAAINNDVPLLLGTTFVAALATVAGSLLADVLYAIVDPRVRYA